MDEQTSLGIPFILLAMIHYIYIETTTLIVSPNKMCVIDVWNQVFCSAHTKGSLCMEKLNTISVANFGTLFPALSQFHQVLASSICG